MDQYSEILSTTYWGNTVGMWAIALFGVLASLIFSKIVFKILKKVGTMLASRTKTNIDDALFDAVEEPLLLKKQKTKWMTNFYRLLEGE